MFKKNILSMSIWVLAGILILIAIGVVLWRIFSKNKIKEERKDKNIGSASKEFNDFIISLSSTTNFEILYNILIKNKYSKSKFSLIPGIIFLNNKGYLLTNIISSKKYNEVIFKEEDNNPYYLKNNKEIKINNIDFKWSKDIFKYLKHEIPNANFGLITPIATDGLKITNNKKDFECINTIDFEEEIIKLDFLNSNISTMEKDKIIKKLSSNNLFKSKVSSDKKNLIYKGRN